MPALSAEIVPVVVPALDTVKFDLLISNLMEFPLFDDVTDAVVPVPLTKLTTSPALIIVLSTSLACNFQPAFFSVFNKSLAVTTPSSSVAGISSYLPESLFAVTFLVFKPMV